MAKDTLELIEGVGWSGEPINIVGTSMGGMIAMELSLLAPPDTIRTLTLSSTTSGRTLFGRECVAANIKCLFLDKQLDKTKVILEVLHSNVKSIFFCVSD
ncbi:hypothetical protein AX774_g248 [Zancudomyces culisetae]|uniref:AB hydrolase-1 domain-containing protein n=1 Tax=Zancudomyces culisetae TaxID=1213189 RepID=A0A1R1PYZ2_ZANCU|nr:hypothetical protein AX774_g248 [Zancudomyces culisetae]|eukprot:OMH86176.1 hypothetical protein AX774_g248 [Zancudomyces culisetae]